jgi:predicted  nucleic acid-binding Zn-ribbon protein
MTDGEVSRIERAIESLRTDSVAVREGVAALNAQFDMWAKTDERTQVALKNLEKAVLEHESHDEAMHAQLQTDMRRLWWGIGLLLTSAAGIFAALLGVMK